MTTVTEQKIDKRFTVIETLARKNKKGDEIIHMQILEEEIQRFLADKIRDEAFPHYQQVQGAYKPFSLFCDRAELGLFGGQISIFVYSNEAKDEGFVSGVNGGTFQDQAEQFWNIMNPEKGHLTVHFVWYAGPLRKEPAGFMERDIYDGKEMKMFRFSFRLRRESSSSDTVLLYNLKIIKEEWRRTDKQELIIE